MISKILRRGAVATALLLVGLAAHSEASATVDMSGVHSYRYSGDQATLEVDRITNHGSTTTGTLYLTLWMTATSNPYTTGHIAARASLSGLPNGGQLGSGESYENVSVTTTFAKPAAGTYYVHLFLSEEPDLSTSLDLLTFTSTQIFYPETVDFVGTVGYSINGTQATLTADRIENNRSNGTGTLYLTLWMTGSSDPYTDGYTAARASLVELEDRGRLMPGYHFSDISLTTDYNKPPPGTYYVHFYLSEYPNIDTTLDILTFSSTITIDAPERTVDMYGVGYRVDGDEVELSVDRIINNTSSTTGTLNLTLWMTQDSDPSETGHRAARISLATDDWDGTLAAEQSLDNLSLTADYTPPSAGTYHVHLYLSESPDLDEWLYLVTFNNLLTVGVDDHADNPDSATAVTVGVETEGRLEKGGDIDVFSVTLDEAGTLRVYTTGSTDTHGTLSTTDAGVVAVDDDSGDGLNFLVEHEVEAGTWHVSVRGYDRSTTGEYSLWATFEAAPERPEIPGISADRHLGDFNGDGKADVLLRNTEDGSWYYYAMDGRAFIEGQSGDSDLPTDLLLAVAGIGDFNGDGKDDLMFRHADGTWRYYPMNGKDFIADQQGSSDLPLDLDYRVAGIGDLNGDGKDDVLLRHDDGRWRYYPMNGKDIIAAEAGTANLAADLQYRIAGIGDFNGDDQDDVLLRHTDGSWFLYVMSGRRFTVGTGPADLSIDLANTIAGVGDFDGDGRADVLLRNTDGTWYFYAMNGRRHVAQDSGAADLATNLAYSVDGIGDLDGDGKADVLLRHTDGRWLYQPMSGRQVRLGKGELDIRTDTGWTTPVQGRPSQLLPGTISGVLELTDGLALDGDTRDFFSLSQENGTVVTAQWVLVPATVAGFAHAERDLLDVYRIAFPAPVRISLAIADGNDADLDLYLAETDGAIIEQSLGIGELEAIQTTREGEHLVLVSAYSGASNYSLVATLVEQDGQPASSSHGTPASSWSMDGEFVPGELILKRAPTPKFESDRGTLEMKRVARSFGVDEMDAWNGGRALARVGPGSGFDAGERALLDAGFRFATPELRRKAQTLMLRKRMLESGSFEYVEPNYILQPTAIPNDSHYSLQWHYPDIALPQAWNISTGSDDVVIAVIDTGVLTDHPEISSRLLRDDNDKIVGYDFISDAFISGDGDGRDSNPYDEGDSSSGSSSSFHGTHVAATIAAATNNGEGVAGVTWKGRIMPIRVLGSGGGTSADIAEGILYAAGLANASNQLPPRSADVINLSLGPNNDTCIPSHGHPDLQNALRQAVAAGVVVVVSAGNDNCRYANPMGKVEGVISVGATDLRGGRAYYSNFGDDVDVVAPGGDMRRDLNGDGYQDGVLSAVGDDTGAEVEHTFRFLQGTSMAAPHVAGVAALMLAVNPDLTPADIRNLVSGAHADPSAAPITRDLDPPGRDAEFGYGLIDAYRAVRTAKAIQGGTDDTPDRPVLAVSPASLHFGATSDVLRARLTNAGGSELFVHSIDSDESWLTVSLDDWPTLVARVDREGLSEGTHVARIAIASDGGDLSLRVTAQVQTSATASDVGTVYVNLLDPQTREIQQWTFAGRTTDYGFEIPDVSPGIYWVVAGTDRDGDGYFCDAGEACGMWPLMGSPATIRVDGDQKLTFSVSLDLFARLDSQSHVSDKVGPRGFAVSPEIQPAARQGD